MLSKVLLALFVLLIASKLSLTSKFGLKTRLRQLKPKLDRGINWIIAGLVLIYVGQLTWWLFQAR